MFLVCTSYITKLLISFGAVQCKEKTGVAIVSEVALSVLFRSEGELERERQGR